MFQLICEDATALGSGMGTERTYYMWNELFTSVREAKKYAEGYNRRQGSGWAPSWEKDGDRWAWDAGCFFFEIRRKEVR